MTFQGTIAAINTALNGLTFSPTADFNGAGASLQVVTNDLGNTGSGGAKTDTDSVAITVNAVNDAPVNTVPGLRPPTRTRLGVFGRQPHLDLRSRCWRRNRAADPHGDQRHAHAERHRRPELRLRRGAGDGTADATMTFRARSQQSTPP